MFEFHPTLDGVSLPVAGESDAPKVALLWRTATDGCNEFGQSFFVLAGWIAINVNPVTYTEWTRLDVGTDCFHHLFRGVYVGIGGCHLSIIERSLRIMVSLVCSENSRASLLN